MPVPALGLDSSLDRRRRTTTPAKTSSIRPGLSLSRRGTCRIGRARRNNETSFRGRGKRESYVENMSMTCKLRRRNEIFQGPARTGTAVGDAGREPPAENLEKFGVTKNMESLFMVLINILRRIVTGNGSCFFGIIFAERAGMLVYRRYYRRCSEGPGDQSRSSVKRVKQRTIYSGGKKGRSLFSALPERLSVSKRFSEKAGPIPNLIKPDKMGEEKASRRRRRRKSSLVTRSRHATFLFTESLSFRVLPNACPCNGFRSLNFAPSKRKKPRTLRSEMPP